jgi:hypothetical protein
MRSPPFTFSTALGIHAAIAITKPTTVLRFTTASSNQTFSGNTFVPYGAANLTQIQYLGDGSPANADVRIQAISGGLIEPGEAARGALDGLPISIGLFDIGNPSAGLFEMMPGATIGSALEDSDGVVTIAAQGPLAQAKAPVVELFTVICKAKFGDDRCKIPLDVPDIGRNVAFVRPDIATGLMRVKDAYGRVRTGTTGDNSDYANIIYQCTVGGTTAAIAPTYDPTVGNLTVDGTATFIAQDAWLRYAVGSAISLYQVQLTALPDPLATSDANWFALSNLIPRSGPLTGQRLPIRSFDNSTFIATLFEPYPMSNFPTGTQFDIHRGCDHRLSTCVEVFANVKNFRGTPYAPGADLALSRGDGVPAGGGVIAGGGSGGSGGSSGGGGGGTDAYSPFAVQFAEGTS